MPVLTAARNVQLDSRSTYSNNGGRLGGCGKPFEGWPGIPGSGWLCEGGSMQCMSTRMHGL